MCRVVGCGQGKPKYAGNRGVQAKMTLNYPGGQVNTRFFPRVQIINRFLKESYWYESPGDYWDKRIQWKSPTFLLSGDKHTYFFDWSNAAYYHNIMAAGYFIVPFDGVYTFHVSADDRAELRYDFDDQGKGSNGYFEVAIIFDVR